MAGAVATRLPSLGTGGADGGAAVTNSLWSTLAMRLPSSPEGRRMLAYVCVGICLAPAYMLIRRFFRWFDIVDKERALGLIPPTLRRYLLRLAFLPTLSTTLFLHYYQPTVRRWYDIVDDTVVLGALPFRSTVAEMKAMGVRGVINTCDEAQGWLERSYTTAGIEQLCLPTMDFQSPTLEQIEMGVAFLERFAEAKQRVYVHCKAGRGRSSTLVACWLIKTRGMTPSEAQKELNRVRPHVSQSLWKRPTVLAFAKKLSLERDV